MFQPFFVWLVFPSVQDFLYVWLFKKTCRKIQMNISIMKQKQEGNMKEQNVKIMSMM